LTTPNLELLRFLQVAREADLHPVVEEYHGDKLVAHNPLKRALGSLVFEGDGGPPHHLSVIDWSQQGRPIREVVTRNGNSLASFHRALLESCLPPQERPFIYECTPQYQRHAQTTGDYYEAIFRLCTTEGVLFEDFLETPSEVAFVHRVILPAFRKVEQETGMRPLVVRICPPEVAHDPEWTWYPHHLLRPAMAMLWS